MILFGFSGSHAGGHCGGYFSLPETETLQKQRPLPAKWMMIHMLTQGEGENICVKRKFKLTAKIDLKCSLLKYLFNWIVETN